MSQPVKTQATPTTGELNATTAEVQAEAVDETLLGTFGIRPDLFIAQLFNFILVLLVLWRFAYKPIMKMLDEREKRIAKSIKDAEEIGKRLKEVEDERENILQNSRIEAQAIVEKAMHETEERKKEMIDAAKREVERVIVRGKDQLAEERDAMMLEMRKEIIDVAIRAAAKIALEKVDEKKSQSLAEEVVRKLT